MTSPHRILSVIFALGLGLGAAAAGPLLRPVVVELYTSQGCSSCPPADAILGKLADQPGVIAISLPITYWDMLGWKDTLASDANTRRQKSYAAAMGHGGIYTPQVIVDGVADVVGSRAAGIDMAIAQRRAQIADALARAAELRTVQGESLEAGGERTEIPAALTVRSGAMGSAPAGADPLVPVAVSETPQEMHIDIAGIPAETNATIWMFHLRSVVSVKVGAGENAGHTITYRNVAGDVKAVGVYKGKALTLTLPRAAMAGLPHDGVAVVVQKGGYGHVIGAAYVSRPDYYAAQ